MISLKIRTALRIAFFFITFSCSALNAELYYHWGKREFLEPIALSGVITPEQWANFPSSDGINASYGPGLYVSTSLSATANYADSRDPYVLVVQVHDADHIRLIEGTVEGVIENPLIGRNVISFHDASIIDVVTRIRAQMALVRDGHEAAAGFLANCGAPIFP